MLMKVFNKGQVVIPSKVRHALGIEIGDMVDVAIDFLGQKLAIKKPGHLKSEVLAGCFAKYKDKHKISFPSRREMEKTLAKGLSNNI